MLGEFRFFLFSAEGVYALNVDDDRIKKFFSEVSGQNHVVKALQNSLKQNIINYTKSFRDLNNFDNSFYFKDFLFDLFIFVRHKKQLVLLCFYRGDIKNHGFCSVLHRNGQ